MGDVDTDDDSGGTVSVVEGEGVAPDESVRPTLEKDTIEVPKVVFIDAVDNES